MLLDPLQARILFTDALKHQYAVLAVNADSPAAITDCLEAALQSNSPIIIETSLWQLTGHSFGAGDPILGLARYIAQLATLADSAKYRSVPVVFHTDHIKGPQTLEILTAAITGVPLQFQGARLKWTASTISLDSSELSAEENVRLIGSLCAAALASDRPATLEMEAGVDDGVTPLEAADQLLGAVEKKYPGYLWLWAPGLGSRHGFSDDGFPAFRPAMAASHRDRARKVLGRDVGIVLHGSSGLSEQSLTEAVRAGVVKVNWSSESLLLRSHAARQYYAENVAQLDKRHPKFKVTAMDNGLQKFISESYIPTVCQRLAVLGSTGQASRLMRAMVA